MIQQGRQIYFSILDAFRFLAFLRIFLLHLSVTEDNSFFNMLAEGGEIGVDFFFVLSGFLITYLLIKEKQITGKIDAKKYLSRRALRIWPLYFLGVVIAYAGNYFSTATNTNTGDGYTPSLFYSLTFLENYRMIYYNTFPSGAPLRVFWSLCVEEHFYIIWLLLFSFVSLKKLPAAFLLLWLAGISYRLLFYFLWPEKPIFDTDVLSKMDYFCAGGFAGYSMGIEAEKCKRLLSKMGVVVKNIFLTAMVLFFFLHQLLFDITRWGSIFFPVFSSILLAVTIITAISNNYKKNVIGNTLVKLGKISYGLYVYHTVIIVVLIKIAERLSIPFATDKIAFAGFFVLSLVSTLLVSVISYRYFEKFFLRMKRKSTVLMNESNQTMP